MRVLWDKFREMLFAVLPITALVLILHFTLTPLDPSLLIRFLIGSLLVIVGLSIFMFGIDIGITPLGQEMGRAITKKNKLWFLVIVGFVLGFIVTVAEPDLHILAEQIADVTSGTISRIMILVSVSLGVALMLSLGLVRIVKNIPLYIMLAVLYTIIFILALFTSEDFLPIAFDASGATTGALTVPFVLALSSGVSRMRRDGKDSEKDSFGLVAVASTGAILSVMLLGILSRTEKITGSAALATAGGQGIGAVFAEKLLSSLGEVAIALAPVLGLFLIFQFASFRLNKRAFFKVIKGIVYTFIGLVLFLAGVNAGFMDVGRIVGHDLALLDQKWILVAIAFLLGAVTIFAEPAVHVLTHQIEEVTAGAIKRRFVMIALTIGVGTAVALSILRILIPQLHLWQVLLPGYLIAIALMFVVPKLFVGIAFDSGGVASGPMTTTFVLAFAQGAAECIEGANVMTDGFGIIALVAMTPLIALQLLGFIYRIKSRRKRGNEE